MEDFDIIPVNDNYNERNGMNRFLYEAMFQTVAPLFDYFGVPRSVLRTVPAAMKEVYDYLKIDSPVAMERFIDSLKNKTDDELKAIKNKIFNQALTSKSLKLDVDETAVSENRFKGFSEQHVVYQGTTRAGKTTLFLLHIFKKMYDIPQECYWIDSGFSAHNFQTFQNAVYSVTALKKGDPNSKPTTFFKTSEQIPDLLKNEFRNPSKKLIVFEDFTGYAEVKQALVVQFLSVAKNSGAQVIVIKHLSNRDKGMNNYFGYYVMCQPSFSDYNAMVHGSKKNNEVFAIQVLKDLESKYRAIIHDVSSKKDFFAYGFMGEISSTYEIDKNRVNESNKTKPAPNDVNANTRELAELLSNFQ